MNDYLIKQEDEADCGACCLYSIIKYYKGFVPLEIIKLDTYTTNKGTNFYNLKEAAIKYGFEVHGYDINKLPEDKIPFIAQIRINNGLYHFIVVYKILKDTIICMDPAKGIIKYKEETFYKIFTGKILVLNPINKIIKYQTNNYFKEIIIKQIKDNKQKLLLIIIFSLTTILISLFSIYGIKYIINNNLIVLLLILLIIKNILSYSKNHILAHFNKKNNYSLIINYLNHFFFLPYKYLQLKSSSEIISRIYDLSQIKDFISTESINIIISFLSLCLSFLIIFLLNKIVLISIVIISIMYSLIIYLYNKKYNYIYMLNLENTSSFNNILSDYLSKIITIKNLHKEDFFLHKIKNNLKDNLNVNYKYDIYINKIELISQIFKDISYLLIILLSIIGNYSLDNILLYIIYFNNYYSNLNYFAFLIPHINYLKSIIYKINNIYYLPKETSINKTFNGNIIIRNLTYNASLNKIFDNYNLKISKGDKILIKGENGVGKSTLLNIISSNITDYEGTISIINNKDITDIKDIKNNICNVIQKDNLFTESILNNIVLDKDININKLNLIDNVLNLKSIINKKNNGYNTIVKDNLSGGEKQRIILARALYQDYNILLLDESLSEISPKDRSIIINNINKYYKDKTIIYVSHNNPKYNFDKVIKLTARKDIYVR